MKNLLSGFIGALIGSILSVVAVFYQTNKSFELEKHQFESQLIVNSIDNTSKQQTITNIKFLIEAGLISKKNEKIIPLIDTIYYKLKLPQTDTIVISPQNKPEQGKSLSNVISAQLLQEDTENPIVGAEVYINPEYDIQRTKIVGFFSYCKTDSNGLFEVVKPDKNYRLLIKYRGNILEHTRRSAKTRFSQKWRYNIN